MVELVTIPGSGTRSVWKLLGGEFVGRSFVSDRMTQCHLTEEHFQRLLKGNQLIISTWRDPLAVCITNTHKYFGKHIWEKFPKDQYEAVFRKDMMDFFDRFKRLRASRPVIIPAFVPHREGKGEFFSKNPLKQNDVLRQAYARKDIAPIEKSLGGLLKDLRAYDWDLPVEDWWC